MTDFPAPILLPHTTARALHLPRLADLLAPLPRRPQRSADEVLAAAQRREAARRTVDSLLR
jgi:hypothetical protein